MSSPILARYSCVLAALSLCLFLMTNPAQAQTKPNQLIDQVIDALGGPAFLDVKDIHTTGRFFAFTRGQLSGSDIFSDYIKFPDMERVEFGPLTRRTTQINRGKEGWKIVGKKTPDTQDAGHDHQHSQRGSHAHPLAPS